MKTQNKFVFQDVKRFSKDEELRKTLMQMAKKDLVEILLKLQFEKKGGDLK